MANFKHDCKTGISNLQDVINMYLRFKNKMKTFITLSDDTNQRLCFRKHFLLSLIQYLFERKFSFFSLSLRRVSRPKKNCLPFTFFFWKIFLLCRRQSFCYQNKRYILHRFRLLNTQLHNSIYNRLNHIAESMLKRTDNSYI